MGDNEPMICHAWEWGRTYVNSLSGGRQRDFKSNGNHISREISCLKRSKRRHQHSLIRVHYPPREHLGIQERQEKDLECLWVNSYVFWENMGARCCSAAAWGRKYWKLLHFIWHSAHNKCIFPERDKTLLRQEKS